MSPSFAAIHRGLAVVGLLALLLVTAGPSGAERKNPLVKLTTNLGDITLELDAAKAPKSAQNFLDYVNAGFYNGTVFHRIIAGFMIQGGGMTADMRMKAAKSPIQNEADNGLLNQKYTVAMARTQDPHSASAQFFINVADNDFLNHKGKTPDGWGYAVFGKVVQGQEVVDKIAASPTGKKGWYEDVPKTPVVIEKAEVVAE